MSVHRSRLASLTVLSALLACGDPVTPGEVAGTYTLTAVDTRALPRLLRATIECDQTLVAGTLTLEATGQFLLDLRGSLDCSRAGGPVQDIGWEYPGAYVLAGRQVLFTSPEYPVGEVRFTGTLASEGLMVRLADESLDPGNTVALQFRRST